MNIILLHFAIKYKGDWDKIYQALEAKEKVGLETLKELENNKDKMNYKTILDLDYPNQFKRGYKPPFVVFYEGDLSILKKKEINAIGLQKIDIYNDASKLQELVKSQSVVLNTNKSEIDKTLLTISQENNVPSIIIDSFGIKGPSELNVNSKDLIISERFKQEVILTKHEAKEFSDKSNRLAAAIGDKLILVNSKEDIHRNLVQSFLNQGKDIYCFEQDNKKDFNNELLKQGAIKFNSPKEKEIERGR